MTRSVPYDDVATASESTLPSTDLILFLLARRPKKKLNGITRIEKLAYLVARSSSFPGLSSALQYEPLYYGPYSEEIAEGLEALEESKLVESKPVKFQTKDRGDEVVIEERQGTTEFVETRDYKLTPHGEILADILYKELNGAQQRVIEEIAMKYAELDLDDLIKEVYRAAPDEMLSRSVIKSQMGCR